MGVMPAGFDPGAEPVSLSIVAPATVTDRHFMGMNGPAKRALDIAISTTALVFLAPLLLVVALLVRLDGGPALFVQQRVGRGGLSFPMYKFRTMHINADDVLNRVLASCEMSRAEWNRFQKLRNDPRITPLGRFLRKTSIDELPQLFNVLVGHMSIVGQRPILPSQREAFGTHIAGYERARPGITGLWQVQGRNRLTFQQRAELGTEYVNRWSLWFDIKIILMTLPAILLGSNAY